MSIKDQIKNSYKPKQEELKLYSIEEAAAQMLKRASEGLVSNAKIGFVKESKEMFRKVRYVKVIECYPRHDANVPSGYAALKDSNGVPVYYVRNKLEVKKFERALKRMAAPEGIEVIFSTSETYGYKIIFKCYI